MLYLRQSPEDDPVGNFKIRHGGIRRGEQYAPTLLQGTGVALGSLEIPYI